MREGWGELFNVWQWVGMTLLADISAISEHFGVVNALRNNRIYDVIDFLREDVDRLMNITKLSCNIITDLRELVINKYAARPIGAERLYRERLASVPTRISGLDEVLEGGLACGDIVEISGSSGSGKTQLVLTITSNVSSIFKYNILYIDSKGDFSGSRLHEILMENGHKYEELGVILERIKTIKIWNAYDLISFLYEFHRNRKVYKHFRIIIIDSLSSLIIQHQNQDKTESFGLLNDVVNIMRYVASEYNITFLVLTIQSEKNININKLKGDADSSVQIENRTNYLGKHWQYVPSLRLHLRLFDKHLSQTIEIEATNSHRTMKTTVFISSRGVI